MEAQSITEAFRKLYKARQDLYQTSETTIECRQALESERMARMMTGELFGKNETEREARARELFIHLYVELETAEQKERQARLALDLAKIEVERLDYLLRRMALK